MTELAEFQSNQDEAAQVQPAAAPPSQGSKAAAITVVLSVAAIIGLSLWYVSSSRNLCSCKAGRTPGALTSLRP